MKRLSVLITRILFSLLFVFFITNNIKAIAAKEKKPHTSSVTQAQSQPIEIYSIDGNKYIYGSVLNPNVNQVLFYLPKSLLYTIRKLGLNKLSVSATSVLDSTKTFAVPLDAVNIQTKKINKKFGRYLVANISNLNTTSGITISPSSLPTGDYRLRVAGKGLDITTSSFNYQTPILIVGTVQDDNNSGFVTVEDLNGNIIADKPVAISLNGAFLTEVRANNLKRSSQDRTIKKKKISDPASEIEINDSINGSDDNDANEGHSENSQEEKISVGLVHAVTDKDLYAVVALDNDIERNALKAEKPIELSEGSTLTAILGKEYEDLADEAAEEQLKELEEAQEEKEEFQEFGCDIYQFANKCNLGNTEALIEVGALFKRFLSEADCDFSEFELIKNIVANAPDEVNDLIGKGYCQSAIWTRDIDEDKSCEVYFEILSDFKFGTISQLPCPPDSCPEFRNIKPPRCVKPVEFCDNTIDSKRPQPSAIGDICRGPRCKNDKNNYCINKPIRDLYCARVGTDISEVECKNSLDAKGRSTSWTVVTNSRGNQYCVPTTVDQMFVPQAFQFGTKLPTNPQEVAEECEVSSCHRSCEDQFASANFTPMQPIDSTSSFTSKCDVCDCHFNCDVEAGRVIDCGNPKSKYFSIKCCGSGVIGPTLFTQSVSPSSFGGGRPSSSPSSFGNQGGFGLGRGPVYQDLRGCLCTDSRNFNSNNGFVKEDAQNICKDKCPPGYEKKDIDSEFCLPVCEEGQVSDHRGFCRKKCPEGFIEEENGTCRCPEGQTIRRNGKCEEISNCPEYCKNYTQPVFSSTSISSSMPPECQRCFDGGGPGICTPGQKRDPDTGQCVNESRCGTDQYLDLNGICRCNYDSSVASGPDSCKRQNSCSSNMMPNDTPGEAKCICPPGLPYWDSYQCVAQCPNGTPPPSASANLPPRSPIPCNWSGQQNQCSGATPYLYRGTCVANCPSPLVSGSVTPAPAVPFRKATLKASHEFGSTSQLECLCPGQTRPDANGQCQSTNRTCTPHEVSSPQNPCTCANGAVLRPTIAPFADTTATPFGTSTCQCLNGQPYTVNGCNTSSTRICLPGEIPSTANCTCASGATLQPAQPPFADTTGGSLNTASTCQCPTGQLYTVDGCKPTTQNCGPGSSLINNKCICWSGIKSGLTTQCECAIGSTLGSNGVCQCPEGQAYLPSGCITTARVCSATEFSVEERPCKCAQGAIIIPGGPCVCVNGQTYSIEGCAATTRTCGVGEVSNNTNPCKCAGTATFNSQNICTCTTGQTYSTTGCTSTNVNYCDFGWSTVTSNCVCASGATPNASNICTCSNGQNYTNAGCGLGEVKLTSVVIDGTNVIVNYSKNFITCAHLKNSSNAILHTQNHFCSNTGPITVPLSSFNSSFQNGISVKLCHGNNGNLCSPLVVVTTKSTTTTTCAPGQASTTTSPCQCAGTATTGSSGLCYCQSGQTYTTNGCVSSDTTPPLISSITASSITQSNASINWWTNEVSDSQVEYGLTTSYGSQASLNTSQVTYHSVALSGLSAGTTYHYRVKSRDASGNLSISSDQMFTTSSAVSGMIAGTIDLQIKDVTKGTFHPYGFHCNLCVNGPYSFNELKTEITSLKSIPVAYYVYDSSGTRRRGNASVSGSIEDIKNGQCIKYGFVVQTTEQPYYDQTKKIELLADPDSIIAEASEINNAASFSEQITTTTCASGQVSTSTSPCSCASGASFNSSNICTCPSGQIYSTNGCTPETVSLTSVEIRNGGTVAVYYNKNFSECALLKTANDVVVHGQSYICTAGNTSVAITGSIFNQNLKPGVQVKLCHPTNTALCSNLVTVNNAFTPRTCGLNEAYPTTNPCTCATGASFDSQHICQCPTGQIYSTNGCTTPPRITLNSASVSGGTITFDYTKDTSDAFKLYTSGGVLLNIPNHAFGGASGVGYPLSTLNNNLQPNIQVKLCYSSEPAVCSNTVTLSGAFTTHTCDVNEAYSWSNICNCASGASPNLQNICTCSGSNIYSTNGCQSPAVYLYSAVISGSNVTVNYNKNFTNCVTLKYSNSSTAAHTGDLFCTNNGPITVPLSTFDQTKFQNSVSIKLCDSQGSTCSSTIQVSGPQICIPGEWTTNGTCTCFSPAGPDQNDPVGGKRCACPAGSVYTNSNGASFCRRYCNVGESYNFSDPCSCGVYGGGPPCSCSNGATYNSQTGCGADRHI